MNHAKSTSKRQLSNILLVYIDTIGGDTIKQVLIWILEPNKLTFSTNYFNSNNIIDQQLTVKTTMEKVAFFIKGANETGKIETSPELVVWGEAQLTILKQYIPTLHTNQGLVGHITILQDRCRDIFKHQLVLQGFSLVEVSDIMGIDSNEISCKKFALVALKTEQALKKMSRELKFVPPKKTENKNESDRQRKN